MISETFNAHDLELATEPRVAEKRPDVLGCI